MASLPRDDPLVEQLKNFKVLWLDFMVKVERQHRSFPAPDFVREGTQNAQIHVYQ